MDSSYELTIYKDKIVLVNGTLNTSEITSLSPLSNAHSTEAYIPVLVHSGCSTIKDADHSREVLIL